MEARASGTLSPQNLPGKGKRTVRMLAGGKRAQHKQRERAVLLQMRFKASSPHRGTHPVALKDEKLEPEAVTAGVPPSRRVSDANQPNTQNVVPPDQGHDEC